MAPELIKCADTALRHSLMGNVQSIGHLTGA